MIKARLTQPTGRPVLLFGLEKENTTRLHKGQPVKFNLRVLGDDLPDADIVIIGGENHDDLINQIKQIDQMIEDAT